MSVLSKALRMAVVVSAISGCAAKTSTDTWTDSSADSPAPNDLAAETGSDQTAPGEIASSGETYPPASTETAAIDSSANIESASAPADLTSEQVLAKTDAGVEVKVEKGTGYTKVLLGTDNATPNFEVSSMGEPPRLVVDLIGANALGSKSLALNENSFVRSIRLGNHADRARVVFDLTELASDAATTYRTIDREQGAVAVTFRTLGSEVAAVNNEAVQATTSEIAANSAIEERTAPTETISSEPAVSQVAANDVVAKVEAVNFYKAKETAGQVSIDVRGKAPFQLEQTSASEYTLFIRGASAEPTTMLPQIAPAGKAGIRSTRAVEKNNDVLVRMFVDPGIELRAKSSGQKIVIDAYPTEVAANLPALHSEARGQMQPEGEAAGTDATAAGADSGDETARRNPTGFPSSDGSKIYTGRLISLDLQETDIDNALRIIAEVSNLNIIASDDVTGKVTLRLVDVPWDQALDVILKTNGLDQVTEGNVIRIAPVDKLRQEREALREAKKAAENLEDLRVHYIRISYARASDLKEQAEAVLTERGSVAIDERTNQIIIKDIQKGIDSTTALIKKLDLRTPQVLLETQVVEASRGILRELGFQWNFESIQSPATGNATGSNFPNSVVIGGSNGPNPYAVDFPSANAVAGNGSAISAILESADGTRSLTARLSAFEQEGKVKVISRPQVATVNNKEAEIRSVETIRIRLPDSGLSVATGQGATASGGGNSAFEEIDVGITLRVTPQAAPDYYVLLDVNAQSTTFGDRIVDNIPSTREREATSTILVKSGQTFALGGVYRIEEEDRVSGVPFLKDLPFLGHAFRRTLIDKGDEELIFFITPHIVEGSFDPSLM